MSLITEFESRLPAALRREFRSLKRPIDIQRTLNSMAYVSEDRDRCPLDVMKDRQCHCLDGGLFAALALRHIGDPGLLIDLAPLKDSRGRPLDDDHVLAVFRRHGRWGAIAKSNFAWLRYRDPVYRSPRELVMSYFEAYVSVDAIKVLRGYTRPMDISRYDGWNYAWDEGGARKLYKRLYSRAVIQIISPESAALLEDPDQLEYDSGFMGVNMDWVYRPPK